MGTFVIWCGVFYRLLSPSGKKIMSLVMLLLSVTCAINYMFFSMCATNAAIILLEMPKYGFVESISSVVTCLITFGEAEGFVRALEIHDITFLFGQFFIYYMMFAPKGSKPEKRIRRLGVILSVFFMLPGFVVSMQNKIPFDSVKAAYHIVV